ncbi:MAG: hypothetical protein ABI865_15635 [Nitrosospira sp.]|jgi:TnpA family transposase
MDIQKSYTDSRGQSEVGFVFCYLLGQYPDDSARAVGKVVTQQDAAV